MKKILPVVLFLGVIAAVFAPVVRAQESDVARILSRGDAFFEKNEYKSAITAYFEAAALSTQPANLSRAYFGLSLSYFYERDMAESVKWMRKIALVDPNKEIAAESYPKPYVDLFNQVLREAREKGAPAAADTRGQTPTVPVMKPAPPKTEPQPRTVEKPVFEADPSPGTWQWGGHFELSVHFSSWSVNLFKGIFESTLENELGEAIQSEINKRIERTYPGLIKGAFTPSLAFDSEGSNYGLEFRYYARGWAGTFSLGLSLEKTNIKLSLVGTARQEFTNGGLAEAQASAIIETKPFSTNFSFRWEIGAAEARIKPFFTFGIGLAPLSGTFSYAYNGTYSIGTNRESIEDAQTKSFQELSEDIDFVIPKLIVILQIHVGVKIELYRGLCLLGEAGIWDGLLLRGGLGFRF
jgi:hypothetical protein